MTDYFRKWASRVACALGSAWAFCFAFLLVLAWGLAGPYFHYSEGWQLVINTSTTIGTFLMVFVVQNSQNRDAKAIHLKLDELLRAVEGARTAMANVGDLSDAELENLEDEFHRLAGASAEAPPSTIREAPLPPTNPVAARRLDATSQTLQRGFEGTRSEPASG